jgi:proteasome lid subunit RPN8/RPN11
MTSASTSSDASATRRDDSYQNGVAGEIARLPQRPAPDLRQGYRLHGCEPGDSQVQVIISQAALQQADAHSRSNLAVELGGALLGHAFRAGDRVYVEVLAALAAVSQDHGPVHFTFTADAWAQLHQDLASHYPELNMIGWFHTHPDLGVFFSVDDVVVHSAAFVQPWHLALVLDPVRAEGCFFGWQNDTAAAQITPLAGFYERLDEQPESVVDWHMPPTRTIRSSQTFIEQARQMSAVLLPDNEWPALPPISPWWGVFMGGLSLLLSLILLLERLLAR